MIWTIWRVLGAKKTHETFKITPPLSRRLTKPFGMILIDTNAYTAFKRGDADALEIIQRAPQFALPIIVVGELLAGFAAGGREEKNKQELELFLASARVTVLLIDKQTTESYAKIYASLRAKGQPIPTNDLWIAALALQHNTALFSFDAHFQNVTGLTIGNNATSLGL
jgi:tRNA(fMet)-specific endonuclease VapC